MLPLLATQPTTIRLGFAISPVLAAGPAVAQLAAPSLVTALSVSSAYWMFKLSWSWWLGKMHFGRVNFPSGCDKFDLIVP